MRPVRRALAFRASILAGSAAAALAVPAARAAEPAFPPGNVYGQDVSAAALDPQSASVIAWLESQGGFGLGRLQIDFSIEVLEADASTPFLDFTPTADFYDPDCDRAPMPVPAGGALEGESGYACTQDGDCHLIVWHRPSQRLYEMWRADLRSGVLRGGCLAIWNLALPPPPNGRGEGCTSADAGGLPIAPLLFSADEVAAGEIPHAVRFALPNPRIRSRTYVRPATHATGAASGGSSAPPYGARLRLRADYPVASLPTAGARVLARALQRYGMILADGGNVALMGRSDRFTTAKWSGLLGPRDLASIRVSDFELVDGGARFAWAGDCQRSLSAPGRPTLVSP
jgi:serine/threonine-protein kinase